ncbi:MAG: sensor histidine kinase [Chloroflexi bacterium]|nr:MAG: sensor histidine kinase [Chloroflexota bacterium]
MRGRPWSWITGRPRLTDGLIVGFNLLIGSVGLIGTFYRHSLIASLIAAVVLQAAALWWRRNHPVAVFLVVVCIETATLLISADREPSSLALAFAAYAVSVYDSSRFRLVLAGGAIAIILAAIGFLLVPGAFQTARMLLPIGALSLVAWVIGDYVRSRQSFFREIVARHQKEREQATEEERLRIARELHDVVAHNVSVMAIQAGAARVSGKANEETLQSIEQGARETLSELNKLLGVLRKPGAPELVPQPTLDDIDALLKPARDAGLAATVKVSGERRPLPAAVDLSAYRIVQEAITNVLKHANANRVEVLIDYAPAALQLTIRDNGSGPAAAPGTGHGLVGMRERVELFGGEVSTGSSSLGGFTVRARLPFQS